MIKWPTPVATPISPPLCVWVARTDNLLPQCIPIGAGVIGGTQRKCASTGSIGAGVASQVCVTWDDGYGSGSEYTVNGWIEEAATNLAALRYDHTVSSYDGVQACAVVFNQDATNARTGTLCMEAFPN